MSKRRRRRPRGSNQPANQVAAKQPQFTIAEEAFFAAGERVHETHIEYEPERPSLWRRMFARITLSV